MSEFDEEYGALHTEADALIQGWSNLTDGVAELLARLAAAEALHHRRPWHGVDFVHFGQTEFPDLCAHCRRIWPCATVVALQSDPSA